VSRYCDDVEAREHETERLVAELREARNETRAHEIRHALIVLNMPVAVALARRYRARGENFEDLVQTAHLALVKTVNTFDPHRGVDLLAYVVPTITGDLKKHFRDRGWDIRPPRRIQELRAAVDAAATDLIQQLGRSPRTREIAEHLGIDQDDVVECLAAGDLYSVGSLDTPVTDDGAMVADTLGQADDRFALLEDLLSLQPALQRLPERERRVLTLRFFQEWTQQQIAEDIGVTQMQVSRILTKVLHRLRTELAAA